MSKIKWVRFGTGAPDMTDSQILEAAQQVDGLHEHPDCVRIALAWLGAQRRIQGPRKARLALKHDIERWGGRYVSSSDVEVAATILGLKGKYPRYNFSGKVVLPNSDRLANISEAGTHLYRIRDNDLPTYSVHELPAFLN